MDRKTKDAFLQLWPRYFDGAALPITLYYTDDAAAGAKAAAPGGRHCLIDQLRDVREGDTLVVDKATVPCPGGKRYMGFTATVGPQFEYFLSYGIPGKLEGERYKKSPEIVRESMKKMHEFKAPAKFAVFKRWDALSDADNPDIVIFFATPDVLSGLFTLANFDETDPFGVVAPFAAGCGTIVQYPYLEAASPHPRPVVGMLDVSARPCVEKDVISFAVPMLKFARMVENMNESFLITNSWKKVLDRIAAQK